MFKKIACAALALTLLGTTAAEARGGWGGGHGGGWGHHGGGWHGGHGDWALGLGLGILALGAVSAASNHDHYYRERDAYDRGRYDQDRYDNDRAYNNGDGRAYNRDEDRGPPPGDRNYDENDGEN